MKKKEIIAKIKKEVDKYTGYIPYAVMEEYWKSIKIIKKNAKALLKEEYLRGYRKKVFEINKEKVKK